MSCSAFTPLAVNAKGLGLQGLAVQLPDASYRGTNLSFQYAITNTMSANVAYVFTDGSNLQQGIGNNQPFELVPANTSLTSPAPGHPNGYIPFPDFGGAAAISGPWEAASTTACRRSWNSNSPMV